MSQTHLRVNSRDGSRGDAPPETPMDDDDRLRPDFVRQVIACVEAGDDEGTRDLVSPLHPADIADLFELAPQDRLGGGGGARQHARWGRAGRNK